MAVLLIYFIEGVFLKKIFYFILFFISLSLQASEVIKGEGKITKVRIFANNHAVYNIDSVGFAVIYVDSLGDACESEGGKYGRVIISTDHALYQTVVAIALTAKASRSPVNIWHLDTCSLRNNAWDFSLLELK